MITRIIHQSWKVSNLSGSPFKKEWQETWQNQPGWEYRFWTDEDLLEFVREEFPDFLDVYEEYHQPIQRPDSARYLILKRIGGFYSDLDNIRLKDLNSLVENIGDRFMISKEADPAAPNTYGNSIMYSNPNPEFLDDIEKAFRKSRHRGVLDSSACRFITRRIEAGRAGQIYSPDSKLLFPCWWADPKKEIYQKMSIEELRLQFPEAYNFSYWTHSWKEQ